MELVEKNILPVESSLKEAIIGEEAQPPRVDLKAGRRGHGLWTACSLTSCLALGEPRYRV